MQAEKNPFQGAFRFTYFTSRYSETCNFYSEKIGLELEHSWDRNEHDKGALFKAGVGLIEVLHLPKEDTMYVQGLDYRSPQGSFMCIEVDDIDGRFGKYKKLGVPFKQEIVNQSWGHRSFSIIDPNGVVIFFFKALE